MHEATITFRASDILRVLRKETTIEQLVIDQLIQRDEEVQMLLKERQQIKPR